MSSTAILLSNERSVDLAKLNRKVIKHINNLKLSRDFASWSKPTVKRPLRFELY